MGMPWFGLHLRHTHCLSAICQRLLACRTYKPRFAPSRRRMMLLRLVVQSLLSARRI